MTVAKWVRGTLVVAMTGVIGLANPAESHAIFHWFRRCCGQQTNTAFCVAPTYANYACSPNATAVVASYVPQVAYRPQVVSVPVTTYRPVVTYRPVTTMQQTTSVDPCTGCTTICNRPVTTMQPFTAMQPVTSCARQVQMVPYNTYQIVYSTPTVVASPVVAAPAVTASYAAPACPTCQPAAVAAPATTYTPAPSTATPGYVQPGATYSQPGATYSQPGATYSQPGTTYSQPGTTTPGGSVPTYYPPSQDTHTPSPSAAGATPAHTDPAPSTFESQRPANGTPNGTPNGTTNGGTQPMTPIPDESTNGTGPTSTSTPRLIDPDNRTTALPDHSGWARHVPYRAAEPAGMHTVATQAAPAAPRIGAAEATIDHAGWQPSGR